MATSVCPSVRLYVIYYIYNSCVYYGSLWKSQNGLENGLRLSNALSKSGGELSSLLHCQLIDGMRLVNVADIY